MFYIYVFQEDTHYSQRLAKLIEDYQNVHDPGVTFQLEVIQDHWNHFANRSLSPSLTNIYVIDMALKVSDTGIGVARAIRQKDHLGYIIFLTQDDQILLKTFDYHLKAMTFIHTQDRGIRLKLFAALDQILYENRQNLRGLDTFTFKFDKRLVSLACETIEFIETTHMKRTLRIHTGQDQYLFQGTLKEALSQLPDYFIRCHKSFVMNPKRIQELRQLDQQYKVVFSSNKSCLLSKKYVKEPIQLLKKKTYYPLVDRSLVPSLDPLDPASQV